MTNKEKLLELVTEKDNSIITEIKWRKENSNMLDESRSIALKVLIRLTELEWTQKDLAKKMNVSPQHINKILKGKENLTLETQIKIQSILKIPILGSYIVKKEIEDIPVVKINKRRAPYKLGRNRPGNYENPGKKYRCSNKKYTSKIDSYSSQIVT